MDASQANIPVGAHVVFAPPPTANPTLQTAVDVIAQLSSGDASSAKVLFLSDWNAKVLSSCDADEKVINAYYSVLTKSLATISPSLMESVLVVKQSELILSDPSNYWISVINVGRAFNLNVLQEGFDDSDAVGNVIGRMMTLADLSSLNAKSVSIQDTAMTSIITEYFKNIPLDAPTLVPLEATSIFLQDGGVATTENSEYFLLDDPKVHGKLKMKKAFCEPGNVDFCPPISVASVLIFTIAAAKLDISRSPDNGGDVSYSTEEAIKEDFESGALHPGDLKAAVTKTVVELLTKLAAAMKADKEFTQAGKVMKAYIKKTKNKK
jgi:tyrosyl-tRNA synthetase